MASKFLEVGFLKILSASGIFVFSFVYTMLNGLDSFGQFSFMLAVSNFAIIFGRYGCEYSVYGSFIREHQTDVSRAFSQINSLVLFSLIKAVVFFVIFLLLIDHENMVYPLYFFSYVVVFSIVQPYCFALRAIKKFKASFLLDPSFFMLEMAFVMFICSMFSLSKYVETIFTCLTILHFLLFLFVCSNSLKSGFHSLKLRYFVTYHIENVGKFIHSINEYICYWGIVVFFGGLLDSASIGLLSWGVRVFQVCVLIVGIRNTVDAPSVMLSENRYSIFLSSVTQNAKVTWIPLILGTLLLFGVVILYGDDFEKTAALTLYVFFLAAYVRFIFGLIFYIYNDVADTQQHLMVFVGVSAVMVGSLIITFPIGVVGSSFVFLTCWIVMILQAMRVIRSKNV